jgi:hypothetical protein
MLFVVMTLLGISTGIGSTLFGVLWPEIYGVANLGISLPTQMIFYGGYCLLGTAAMMIVSTQLQRRDQIMSDDR